jgi:hypothetical protein
MRATLDPWIVLESVLMQPANIRLGTVLHPSSVCPLLRILARVLIYSNAGSP